MTVEGVQKITDNAVLAEIAKNDDEAVDVSIAAISKIDDNILFSETLESVRPVKRCYIVAGLCSVNIEKIYCDPPTTQMIHLNCRHAIIKAFREKNHPDITFKDGKKVVPNYDGGGSETIPTTEMYYKGAFILRI